MASLVKSYSKEKLYGKVYTPKFIVNKVLDDIQYSTVQVLGKAILDPACGDGQILLAVALRIINLSQPEDLAENLGCIHGWDVDKDALQRCISNLDALLYPIGIKVDWNIHECNSIAQRSVSKKFDFIVGNPPYIRIQHLDLETRQYLKENYVSCKSGATDIFIAFFELSYHLLADSGICGLITPNSYFYSQTAKTLRNLFITYGCIKQISNYGQFQVFDNASTYTAITVFTKQRNTDFILEESYSRFDFLAKRFPLDILRISKPWQLSVTKTIEDDGTRLGDIAEIRVGITTLCDHAYIFKTRYYDETHVIASSRLTGDVLIETELVKPIIKASTFKSLTTETNFILFPYEAVNGNYQIICEEKLRMCYPKAYNYFKRIKSILDKRDNGKPNRVAWYAFGRSQGLNLGKGSKLVFPTMSKKPTFLFDDSEALIYSGYCIQFKGDLEWLASELNSQRMEDFIYVSARDFRGGWKAYNKTVVQEFRVRLKS